MQKNKFNPVVMVTFGVVLVAIAIIMVATQTNSNNPITSSGLTNQIIIAFVTGITTGGLSCLAVQGGLLASSLANQIEQDYSVQSNNRKKIKVKPQFNSTLPISLFLGAKLIAYTFLGALLGWLGSYFTFSPTSRALLMIAILAVDLLYRIIDPRISLTERRR